LRRKIEDSRGRKEGGESKGNTCGESAPLAAGETRREEARSYQKAERISSAKMGKKGEKIEKGGKVYEGIKATAP